MMIKRTIDFIDVRWGVNDEILIVI